MKYFLIIVAPTGSKKLEQNLVEKISKFCRENLAVTLTNQKILAINEALQFNVEQDILSDLKAAFADKTLDFFQIPAELFGLKKLIVFDMDATLIANECIDEIARAAGRYDQVAQVTEAAMQGKLDFSESLKKRVSCLKGISKTQLAEIYQNTIKINPGVKIMAATLNKLGTKLVITSGGFTFFTNKIGQELNFFADFSNQLNFAGDVLDGTVAEPIFSSESKLATLKTLAEKHQIAKNDIMAVGDGANDLPMLHAAGLAVAYKAKPVVKAQIAQQIEHSDFTSLLYMQGISRNANTKNASQKSKLA